MSSRSYYRAAALVAVAALIWATDSVVRFPTAKRVDEQLVVMLEHWIGLIAILPWVLLRRRRELFKVGRKDAGLFLLAGVLGSALGGMAFTRSIELIGPSAGTILELLQPAFVVGLAYVFLKERHTSVFFQVSVWVILNAMLICLPDFGFGFELQDGKTGYGIVLALLAMVFWAVSTVTGKVLLSRHAPSVAVFWRWTAATLFLTAWVAVSGKLSGVPAVLSDPTLLWPLLYIGTVAGSFGMVIYYLGLRHLPVSLATFIELLYPLTGAFASAWFYDKSPSLLQIFGGMTLLMALVILVGSESPQPAKR